MSAIQIILISLLLLIFFYIRSKRKKVIDSVIYTIVILIALIFIIKPDITILIANKLNVGRGTDLVVYLSIVLGLFFYVRLYYRLITLEELVTKLVRNNAIVEQEKQKES